MTRPLASAAWLLAGLCAWLLLAAPVLATPASAALSFPALTGRLVDDAGILPAEVRGRIEERLAGLEARTTTQLVVVTLSSLQGTDIADYGYQLGRAWGVGQKGSDNGALLIVAPGERKVRIEVGYGLEGTLTDAVSRLIIENAILPRFRAGDMPGGVERGVEDIVQVLSGGADDFKQRAAQHQESADSGDWFTFLVIGIVLIVWVFSALRLIGRGGRRRGVTVWPPVVGGWSSGSSGSSSSGRSWSGGSSSGGFSGGGGSFGGGGSSGSW